MTKTTTRLTRAVKIYLDLGWWFFGLAGFVLVPIAGLIILFAAPSEPDPGAQGAGLSVLVGIQVDEAQLLPAHGDGFAPLQSGQGRLRIRSASRLAWGVVIGLTELIVLLILYIYAQLRKVFRAFLDGHPFAEENPVRVRRVGLAIVGWSVVGPLLEYLAAFPVIREVRVRGLLFSPPISFNVDLLFAGLAILVLAEIFRQASAMQRDQSLTV